MNEEPETAVKYTYDQVHDKWKREKVQVISNGSWEQFEHL